MQIPHMSTASDSRAILKEALRRRLDEQPMQVKAEDLPCPAGLNQIEKSAWLQLQNWAWDEFLRKNFASYAEYSRNRLRHLIEVLQ